MIEELLSTFSPFLLLGSLFTALIITIFVYLVYSGLFAEVKVEVVREEDAPGGEAD